MAIVLAASKRKKHGEFGAILITTAAGGPLGKPSLAMQVEQLKPHLHTEKASDRV